MSDDRIECPGCGKALKRTVSGRYRKHGNGDCDFSGTVIQEDECREKNVTSTTASSATPASDDAPDHVPPVTPSTESSPSGQDEAESASNASALTVIPGADEYVTVLNAMSTEQLARYKASVDSKLTPFTQPTPPDFERPTLFSQPVAVNQSGSGPESASPPVATFSQPAGRRSEVPAAPMSDLGKELTARLKEMFYAYDNRRSADNRSAQATMGPSEMGTPCDRRLALSLMRMPPVNPGGDGWAAFVGTCIHAGLEQMFMWADAGTGRFAVEQRLEFPSAIVPKGTADLIDRTLFMLDDHKCQGRWSRNKLKSSGPIPTYRVQAHTYAYGARLRGEKIDHVAIISWPRDESTLDDLYVWTEPYNPQIVKDAFERVDRIAEQVGTFVELTTREKALKAKEFDVADDCRFCAAYLPGARSITDGCNGKR